MKPILKLPQIQINADFGKAMIEWGGIVTPHPVDDAEYFRVDTSPSRRDGYVRAVVTSRSKPPRGNCKIDEVLFTVNVPAADVDGLSLVPTVFGLWADYTARYALPEAG